jgi:DNA replication protein DnaC
LAILLPAADHQKRLVAHLHMPERVPLIIADEVGYNPFDAEVASLFFELAISRRERGSVIVRSDRSFAFWAISLATWAPPR